MGVLGKHNAEQIVEVVRHAGRDLTDRAESLQLLDFSFGDLRLLVRNYSS
jgi:hypothetical protein